MKNVLKENKQFVLITSLLVVIGSLTSMITLYSYNILMKIRSN